MNLKTGDLDHDHQGQIGLETFVRFFVNVTTSKPYRILALKHKLHIDHLKVLD